MTNVSLHFTLKSNTLEEIKTSFEKLRSYLKEIQKRDGLIIHHCFLPRHIVEFKKFDTSLVEFLETIGFETKCWLAESTAETFQFSDVESARKSMLDLIQSTNGTSIFIGRIADGCKDELSITDDLAIKTIQLR
jgi:hypothetical protein